MHFWDIRKIHFTEGVLRSEQITADVPLYLFPDNQKGLETYDSRPCSVYFILLDIINAWIVDQ